MSLFPPALPSDNLSDVARQPKERTKEPIVLDLEGLANRLVELRAGRTYEQMADVTGISAAQYYRLEKQQKPNVSANLLKLLAGKLGVSVTYLIDGPAGARNEPGAYGVAQPGTALKELVREVLREEAERAMAIQDNAPADKPELARKNRR